MPRVTRKASRPRRQWSREEKRRIVGELERSGLSLHAFAKAHDIGESSLTNWRRQFSEAGSEKPRFVELRPVTGGADVGEFHYELSFSSGCSLRLRRGFDRREVESLVSALAR